MLKLDIERPSDIALIRLSTYRGHIAYGVPQSKSSRNDHDNKNLDKPTYNNAEILALMERGSIINNLPKRELLGPVRKKYKEQIDRSLIKVCMLLLQNKQTEADKEMELLATKIENWTKKFFTDPDNNWAPNAPITINGGWMKNKVTGKPIYVKGKKSERPLIDTGSLRQAIRGLFYKGDS